ncbi:MAG: pitrilysin family protein [Polyangiaceae bacterium]
MRRLVLTALLGAIGCAKSVAPTPPPAAPTAAPAPSASAATPDPEPFRATRPAPGAPGAFAYPTPEMFGIESSGMVVYFVKRPTHVVTLELVVHHGASSLPVGKSGLAGLTARMLTEGTRKKSSAALAEAVESLGTSLNADASRDDSSLSLNVLPQDVPRALELLAEVTTQPAFAEAEFQRVRAEWLDGLRAERQDPVRLASLAAVRALLGPSLGAPVDGTLRDVTNLKTADLRDFHQRAYTPQSVALIVVGPLTKQELGGQVAEAFAQFRGKAKLAPPSDAPPVAFEKTRLFMVDRPGAVQSALVVLQPAPKRSEAGHEARQVVGRILGGLFTSRLNMNLREKHAYTYGAFARPVEFRNWGALLASTSVRTDVTAEALDEIVSELKRVADPKLGAPLAEDEIQRAKADLVFSLGSTLEHPSRTAGVVSSLFVEDLPLDYQAQYPGLLRALTRDQLVTTAGSVRSNGLCIVVVGDRAKIRARAAEARLHARACARRAHRVALTVDDAGARAATLPN